MHPVAHNQRAMWLLQQLQPENTNYNFGFSLDIRSALDVEALRLALQRLVARHPLLRSHFLAADGDLVRVCPAAAQLDLSVLDAARWQAEELRERRQAEMQRPFNLATDTPLRIRLYLLAPQRAILQFVFHQIAIDGWSTWIFIDDLRRQYEAAFAGEDDPLPPLTHTFDEYVAWQDAFIHSDAGREMQAFWHDELAGAQPTLGLVTDYLRRAQGFRAATHRFSIDSALTQKLRAFTTAEGSTMYALLLAAFQTLLYRSTGQRDILVGTPVVGRTQFAFARLVGSFVNVVPMRGRPAPEMTFREFLQQTTRKVEAMLPNQHHPFALLAEKLRPAGEARQQPLPQVALNLLSPRRQSRELANFALSDKREKRLDFGPFTLANLDMHLGSGVGPVDLNLEVFDLRDRLAATLSFNSLLFSEESAIRLVGYFCTLLDAIAADPDTPLSRLNLLTGAERQALASWSVPAPITYSTKPVSRLFEAQAARTPEATAVYTPQHRLTYTELNLRANRLARYLQQRGVGPETLVGVTLRRSPDMIVVLLGILKAGGAYLPLDPELPFERLSYILADAAPRVIITDQDSSDFAIRPAQSIIHLDELWSTIAHLPDTNLETHVAPESLAYVIYTSGSTGQPKGVQIPRRAMSNHSLAVIEAFALRPKDRVWQFASLSFDTAVEEIFPTLLSGGTLVLRDAETPAPDNLDALVTAAGLTVLDLPTSYWHAWVRALARTGETLPEGLRLVVVGGEAVDAALYAQWREIPGSERVTWLNTYGPTEATVISTLYAPQSDRGDRVPIGRPLANTAVFILDEHLQPQPVGLPGELYIGGAGVARGYRDRPDLTAAAFIPWEIPNVARLYRTGDRARFLADGNIEFLGRVDAQVKLRGHRIELGEVEYRLQQHPDVAACAVTLRSDVPNGPMLVAYFTTRPNVRAPAAAELRAFLRDWLPAYMLPGIFMQLDALPLTPSKKLDRHALPAPPPSAPSRPESATRTEVEALVAAIWEDVLHDVAVRRDSNFLELGGHSLLATQVTSRITQATGVSLSLRTLFEKANVAELAREIERARATNPPVRSDAIVPVGRERPLPLSFAQERMWFLHELAPDNAAYHISLPLRWREAIDHAAFERALRALVARHEALRTLFPAQDGVPQQQILPQFVPAVRTVDLSSLPVAERETAVFQLIRSDLQRPFDLTASPPWRCTLFRLDEDDYVIYFALHHIIFDQWSAAVLWHDLDCFYQASVRGETPTMPPLPVQYADFAVWQREWLQGDLLEKLLAYWRTQLADVPTLDVPLDRPRPPVQTYHGATEFLLLSPTLAAALRDTSRKAQVTPFMLTLAAFQALLARYTGQTDIVLGVPLANRHRLAVEPIVGTFVNTLVVRTDLGGDPTFAELLARVRDVMLDAYAHQDLPFELLVRDIVGKRDLSQTPLVQVLFNMVNAPFAYQRAAELPVSSPSFDRGAAQFDLSVTAVLEQHLPTEPQIAVEYNTDLFDRATILRLLDHYHVLLQSIVADIDRPISTFELLTRREQAQLAAWNETALPMPSQSCLHDLFLAQAARTPEATAVAFHDQALTYRQLDERSSRLAHHLRSLGIGPESIVGVFMERSLEMVVALLGILKAGGAYLPLDPDFPPNRLAFMVADAGAQGIITDQTDSPFTGDNAPFTIHLPTLWPRIAHLPNTNPDRAAAASNLAYVIYTSGSTGRPKGVQIEHRSVVNFLTAMQERPGIRPDDILLSVTTLSFDISVLEIFLPLASGAQVVIADRETVVDGRGLLRTLRRSGATIMQATPTTWSMLVDAGWEETPRLRLALCGGEALSPGLAASIVDRGPALWNMYGPTETTIWSSVSPVTRTGRAITIGAPIANTTFHIVDEMGRLAPVGVPGELLIGGAGVARGYLGRPQLTAERFVPNPFGSGRLYRTGDLARWRADGTVAYLGRLDFQVKVHGHRIELGEVETAVAAHPLVRKAVVTVHGRGAEQQLVAYAVLQPEQKAPTVSSLRDFLRSHLPDYMLPSAFLFLDEFPLTPNRKVDRKALPAPGKLRPALASEYISPRNPVETVLANILSDLLGLERVGVFDDFFELGGHSLQATRYIARVSQVLRTDIPLWTFLRAPQVAALAKHLLSAPEQAGRITRIAELHLKIAKMKPEEVQRLLHEKSREPSV